ncbi:MAG: LamG-like jellyroll fold domain-containing protein, partial [Bacteroidota bacterium]
MRNTTYSCVCILALWMLTSFAAKTQDLPSNSKWQIPSFAEFINANEQISSSIFSLKKDDAISFNNQTTTSNVLHFDGTDDEINLGDIDAMDFRRGDFSIAFWMKSTITNDANTYILSKRFFCGCSTFWNVGLTPAGNVFLELSEKGCVNIEQLNSAVAVNDGEWHHVVLIRAGMELLIYLDGELNTSKKTTGIADLNNSDAVRMGTNTCAELGFGTLFRGSIEELRIWNKARTAQDIMASMSCELAGDEEGLLAYYDFNQGIASGNNSNETTLLDRTANAYHGNLLNFALTDNFSNWLPAEIPITSCEDICADTDEDGICDEEDNCLNIANADQVDNDGDSIGDLCDEDDDNDGVNDSEDAFPFDASETMDSDSDGIGDNADNCINTPNPDQLDNDNDGIGDNCDSCPQDANNDSDFDGICDGDDNCLSTANADQADNDGDSIGDLCDEDDDNDGVNDSEDAFPFDASETMDSDSDG